MPLLPPLHRCTQREVPVNGQPPIRRGQVGLSDLRLPMVGHSTAWPLRGTHTAPAKLNYECSCAAKSQT